MHRFRFNVLFGLSFGALVAAVSRLLISPASPVESSSGAVKGFFGMIQIVATFLAILLSGNVHGGSGGEAIYWVLVFVQWFVVGLGLSALFRLRGHRDAS